LDSKELIESGIDYASAHGWIVLFITKGSLKNKLTCYKLEYAFSKKRRIIPIMLDKANITHQIAHLHVIEAFGDKQLAVDQLVHTLLTRS
jgi:hypothetical protein